MTYFYANYDEELFKKLKKNNFTVGEMAKLYKIPKQNLIYYDNIDLLKPDHIAPNGYRLYSLMQFLTLDIVLSLRKMDVPIPTIKEYLGNRSTNTFVSLLDQKQEECKRIIKAQTKMIESIKQIEKEIAKLPSLQYEEFYIDNQPERYMLLTLLSSKDPIKKRLAEIITHNQSLDDSNFITSINTGFIIESKQFLEEPSNYRSLAYFTWQRDYDEKYTITPAGSYLTYNFYGTYYQRSVELSQKLIEYLATYKLETASSIYITPITNKWTEMEPNKYINSLSVMVRPKV